MTTGTDIQLQASPAESQRVSVSELMMNPESMDRVMRMAEMMASGRSTIPAHLQKSPADCMAVVLQAMQWGMLPHIVAQKTHIVNGTLGYEAQLVNAVVQASGCITGRFHYEYKGNSPSMECRVGAVIRGERDITWGEWLNESKVTTKNSPLWKVNPRQQMGYLQVKNWARAFAPGAILGIYTPDEIEMIPRNMGAAEVIESPAASPDVLNQAQQAAANGMAAYGEFWKAISGETRNAIGKDEHARLKAVAASADKDRTVDAPAKPAAQQQQPATKTFEEVMTMLCQATTEDALYVGGDWINAITDNDQADMLNQKFDERLAEMRGTN